MENTKNITREFVELVSRSGLSTLDKEYFIAKFLEDGGLKKETEKELIEALENSNEEIKLMESLEDEEVKKKFVEEFKKTGIQEKMEEFFRAVAENEKAVRAREEAYKKHETELENLGNTILKKYNGGEEDPKFQKEFEEKSQEYTKTNLPGFTQLAEAVKKARAKMEAAENALTEASTEKAA